MEAEPIDIVVEPLITPAITISLFEEVSIALTITGLDALPDADQSLEFLDVTKFLNESSSMMLSLESNSLFWVKIPDKELRIKINTTEEIKTRLEETLADMTLPQAMHVGSDDELFPLM